MDIATIKKVFQENGVDLTKDDAWQVQQAWVIKHRALERLAAKFKIKWDAPIIVRAERDEAVVLVGAHRTDIEVYEWSFGECAISQTSGFGNYKVKLGGNMAAYPFSMAEKRGKDRVILKLAGLHGAYSEEEADDFKQSNQRPSRDQVDHDTGEVVEAKAAKDNVVAIKLAKDEVPVPAADDSVPDEDDEAVLQALEATLTDSIGGCQTINSVSDFMLHDDTKRDLKRLGDDAALRVRDHAKKRLRDLGWPGKKAS